MQHLSHTLLSFTVPVKTAHTCRSSSISVRRDKLMPTDRDATAFVQQLTDGQLNVLQVDKRLPGNGASELEKGTRMPYANHPGQFLLNTLELHTPKERPIHRYYLFPCLPLLLPPQAPPFTFSSHPVPPSWADRSSHYLTK